MGGSQSVEVDGKATRLKPGVATRQMLLGEVDVAIQSGRRR